MRARSGGRARVRLHAKYERGFSEAALRRTAGEPAAWRHPPTGDMHISSERNEYIIHNLFRTVDL